MQQVHIAVVPVGKIESADVEAALARVARVLRTPVELRGSLPVPQGVEDPDRRQFRAADLLARLKARVPQLGPGKLVGAESGEGETKPPPQADGYVFVTDVDLFTAKTDGVFAVFNSLQKVAVVSVRRLREPFYRRKSDAAKQRTRLVKEILRVSGRIRGLKGCANPECVVATAKSLVDLDLKNETLCRRCSEWLFEGTIHI